jgi:hypothetical protein
VRLIDDDFRQPSPLENAQGDTGHLVTLCIFRDDQAVMYGKVSIPFWCRVHLREEGVVVITFGNGVEERHLVFHNNVVEVDIGYRLTMRSIVKFARLDVSRLYSFS